MSLETILPFLQPIAHLITDPDVSEVMVNGDGAIFIQRAGRLDRVAATVEQKALSTAVKRIARSLGEDIGESRPLLDARLPDGSRVEAAFPPCSIHGVMLTVRKFRPHWFTLDELVELGAIPRSAADQLAIAVRDRRTILVSGGTDTGKTTFTKALLDLIPQSERLAVIEDTMELKVDHPNVCRFEGRKEVRDAGGNVSIPAVTIRDLVKATLRHRPDRLIIGEVRGGPGRSGEAKHLTYWTPLTPATQVPSPPCMQTRRYRRCLVSPVSRYGPMWIFHTVRSRQRLGISSTWWSILNAESTSGKSLRFWKCTALMLGLIATTSRRYLNVVSIDPHYLRQARPRKLHHAYKPLSLISELDIR